LKQKTGQAKKKETYYEEISGEDEMGVYPARCHVSAVPERRYLMAAKNIMSIALISTCLNAVFGVGVFLWVKLSPNMNLDPMYVHWSELDDRFEMLAPMVRPAHPRHPCRGAASPFCSEVSNERYYTENFLRGYHKARYTVSQDLGDNARRWCRHTDQEWVIGEERIVRAGRRFYDHNIHFGNFNGRSCVVSRYTNPNVFEDYDDFKREQADRWQARAAAERFKRDVEVIHIEPFPGSNHLFVTTMKMIESEGDNRDAPRISYLRTITTISRTGFRLFAEANRPGSGIAQYFNSNLHLEDEITDAERRQPPGITVISHAVLPNKSALLESFYGSLGY
jgi:hypothetical protein